MLAESSLLETTAEVAVTIAGFAGLFLALSTRKRGALQVRVLVLCCVPPLFFAVLPLLLDAFGSEPPRLWRLASAGMVASIVVISASIAAEQRKVADERMLSGQNILSWCLASTALVLSVGNTVGWPWPPAGAPYLLSVWSILGIAGASFTSFMLAVEEKR